MTNFKGLPNELIYMIISHIAQFSYRDRARVACVGKECLGIADSAASYKAQYMRDFAYPPQEHITSLPDTYSLGMFHTSAGSGSDPPHRWTGLDKWSKYECQESNWRRAFIRCHNPYFPQELYTGLPAVLYNKEHRDLEYKYRLKTALSTEAILTYLYGLQMKSQFCRSVLLFNAMRYGVRLRVETQLTIRGWLLYWDTLEPIKTMATDFKTVIFSLSQHPVFVTNEISEMNQRRQERLRRADLGARSCMA